MFVSLAFAVTLAGCTWTRKGGESTQQNVNVTRSDLVINVRNNLIPPTPVYLYLVPSGGGMEKDLGTIYGGDRSVRYEGLPLQGTFQFVARGSEKQVVSQVLVLTKAQVVSWDLQRNFIQVTRYAD